MKKMKIGLTALLSLCLITLTGCDKKNDDEQKKPDPKTYGGNCS